MEPNVTPRSSSINCTWQWTLLLWTERRGRLAVPQSVLRTRQLRFCLTSRFFRIVFLMRTLYALLLKSTSWQLFYLVSFAHVPLHSECLYPDRVLGDVLREFLRQADRQLAYQS